MTSGPPSNPERNDVWVDAGVLKYFDGAEWVLYEEVPDIAPLDPLLVEKGAAEEEEG